MLIFNVEKINNENMRINRRNKIKSLKKEKLLNKKNRDKKSKQK